MFTLYAANCLGNQYNTSYPNRIEVYTVDDLAKAVSKDYVCAEYKDGVRGNSNYVLSNCLALDCDNDHTDNADEWMTPDKLHELFNGVAFGVHYSRHNMVGKNGKTARPKFHVFFPIEPCADPQRYAALKQKIVSAYPFFDAGAKDAGRFFYGTADAKCDIWHGIKYITDMLKEEVSDEQALDDFIKLNEQGELIIKGTRNKTLHGIACSLTKKYGGDNETTRTKFLQAAERCNPPLSHKELDTIWRQAVKFFKNMVEPSPEYIPPEEYKKRAGELSLDCNQKTGVVLKTSDNLKKIIDAKFTFFAYNQYADHIEVIEAPPWKRGDGRWWTDVDLNNMRLAIDKDYAEFSDGQYERVLSVVAQERAFNPAKKFFDELPEWDEIPRLDTMMVNCFDIEDSPYTRAVTRKTLVALVKRVFHPGCKFDYCLILQGNQGIGKSTIWRCIVGDEFFTDSLTLTDMKDKTAAEKLQGYMIAELSELVGRKTDNDAIKSFLTTQEDKYRAPYARYVERRPRKGIMVGTLNASEGFLRDPTGNRRFWVLNSPLPEGAMTDFFRNAKKDYWRQILAEAVEYYKADEPLFLPPEIEKVARQKQLEAMEYDPRLGVIEDFCNMRLPITWNDLSIEERHQFFTGALKLFEGETYERTSVSVAEVWCECFGNPYAKLNKHESIAISGLLKRLNGWTNDGKRERQKHYGRQRIFEKSLSH